MTLDPLTPCSDAACIMDPVRPRKGMHTNGGCQHLKDTSPGLLRAMAAELHRLRALPVLQTCADCGHRMTNGSHGYCVHPSREKAASVHVDDPPLADCPLRGRR
jgi:hypothetical protein